MMENFTNDHTQGSPLTQPKKRGFAAMTPEMRQAIAAKGGKAAHEKGRAFKFNSETGRMAGKIGGKSVSENKEHMAEIGRRGGEASCKAKGYNFIDLDDRRKGPDAPVQIPR